MTDLFYVVLHVASIVAALLAGIMWMRSAYIEVPDITPFLVENTEQGDPKHETIRSMAADLQAHSQALKRQAKFNQSAARAAAAAAAAQAATFALNLLAVLAKG